MVTTSMNPMAARLVRSMTELVNRAQQGRLPDWFYGELAGANLIALQKGTDVALQHGGVLLTVAVWRRNEARS